MLTVKIRGDATHFEKTMAKVKATASSIGGALSTIGKGAAYVATGLTAASVGAGYVALNFAKMAEEGEAAERRLSNIVKSMGLFKGEASSVAERLGELADETARMTGVDDDSILATQAKLMTFRELAKTAETVGGAFDRATQAAIDMAAAGFGSAEQNAVQLGKALNDPVNGINALRRAGITFTEAEKEKIRALVESNQMLKAQEMVLKAIETQVGGTAAATAKGTERIGVVFSQIGEKIGAPISEGLNKLADGLVAQMPKINAAIAQAAKGDFEVFKAAGVVVGEAILAGMTATFATGAGRISESLMNNSAFKSMMLSNPATGASFLAAKQLGVGQSPGGISENWNANNDRYTEALDRFERVAEAAAKRESEAAQRRHAEMLSFWKDVARDKFGRPIFSRH